MKRKYLAFIVWLETAIIGLLGSILGIIGSIPLVYYFHVNPLNFSDYDEKMSGAFEKWGFDLTSDSISNGPVFISGSYSAYYYYFTGFLCCL